MAEDNDSARPSRWSLVAFLKFEAVLIAATTLLLYLQGLIYVEVFCGTIGLSRESFSLSFSDVLLYAWPHITVQGILYGSLIAGILFGAPALIALFELLRFWVIRGLTKKKQRRKDRPESREERRVFAQWEQRWSSLLVASITLTIALGLFTHSFKNAIANAQKDAKSRLENKAVWSVTTTRESSLNLIFLTHLGETYAFLQADSGPHRYVMLPRSEILKMEFSASQPKAKGEDVAPNAVGP